MAQAKSSWFQRFLFFLIFVCVLFVSHRLWMPKIGAFLLVPDELQKADCIVVLRGEEYFRLGKAAELLKQGMAPVIVASVVPTEIQTYDLIRILSGYDKFTETDLTFKILEYFGAKREDIWLTGEETTSTFQEAEATLKFLKQKGFKSMLLVTSTYHMKRAHFLFKHVFKGSGIEIYPVTASVPYYDPAQWWTHERDMRRLAEEYVSFLFNLGYHFVLKKHATSFDSA